MNRRDALRKFGALALLAGPAGFALAQGKETFQTLKQKVPTDAEGKIEVLEFFHYGCPHCRDFEPIISKWAAQLPADVVFTKVPAIWGPPLEALARLYYALVATKLLGTLHEAAFVAVQEERLRLDTEDGVRAWIKDKGQDVGAFMDTYKSFGVQTQLQRAKQLVRDYKISGVPTMAVAGRFVTSATLTGSHEATLKEVNSLIARSRRNK